MAFIFIYLNDRIDPAKLHYWNDQTAVHVLAYKEQFKLLSCDIFVVGGNDSFDLSHCVDYNKIALRYFVGPLRKKCASILKKRYWI